MEIPIKYNPAEVEKKWYQYWMDKDFFHSEPDDREPYTIVIPPPNVTGVLHMGHMLNNTIQDILVRRARMLGKNACWVPGTDHASIATEAKVVAKLKSEGIEKSDIGRDAFLKHAWDWTDEHGGIILEQLKKLGASCDWQRTCFTLDEERSNSVIKVFVDLFNKGLIYRGIRMVNWDPEAKTAVSDEEVIYKEEQSKLYYVRYKIEDEDSYVTIATTRPETILGDTAVCVNPNDKRFQHLKGKRILVPLVKRSVPIIMDDYVDMEFGTGCLKITPAHDANDYKIGMRHNLEVIDTFNNDGTLSEKAQILVGVDRFEARKQIIPMLEDAGNLIKAEDYTNKVGYSERTDVVIEPKLSAQWFISMEKLAKPALDSVEKDEVEFHPKKFKNLYRHWMSNIKDWCISRQLWWGHQIPVYYLEGGDYVVAETKEEALELAKEKTGNQKLTADDLKQDDDVLDTWVSSWLWPISVFGGITDPNNEDIQYYYPTNDLVTGHDIIFFWVARMIMAGYSERNLYPFKNVYFTGMVRDKQRRKMSKSLGNSPDPIELMSKYGADGVRVGMLLCSPAGGDLLFDENLPEQGRNFTAKIWNAFRLVKSWEVSSAIEQAESAKLAIAWFNQKLAQVIDQMNDHFDKFRISDALMTIYTVIRDEFSSWLLEMVKPAYQQPIDKKTYDEVVMLFENLLKLLHPFMPFITEEIWHYINERKNNKAIMVSEWPASKSFDQELINQFEAVKEAVSGIRNMRKSNNIPMKDTLELSVLPGEKGYDPRYDPVLLKMGNLTQIDEVKEEVKGAASFRVFSSTFFVNLGEHVDVETELKKLEEELQYTKGFLNSVMKKLANERFVSNAPEAVVHKERVKQADAEAKIKTLEDQITSLK